MASTVASVDSSGFVDNWQSGKSLAECNLHMLTSGDSCDVSFRVGKNEKIVRAHRYVLISRSSVFHAMLCGPLSEKDGIKIPDVDEDIFSEMLKFLYTNDSVLTPDNVTALLYLSKKYALGGLERLCLTYLDISLSPDNACVILEQAHGFDEKALHEKALKVINQNGEVSITNTGFMDLCHECMDKVVKSKDLTAKPESVFKSVLSWAKSECRRQGKDGTPENERCVLGETVFDIPFTLMRQEDFAKFVVPSDILSGKECTKLFCYFTLSEVDVAPFQVKSEQRLTDDSVKKNYHEVPLYTNVVDVSVQPGHMFTWLFLKPTKDIHLRGFKVYGSYSQSSYSFEVKIDQINDGVYQNLLATKLVCHKPYVQNEIEVQLPEPCLLQASIKYRLRITTVSSISGIWCLGSNLRSTVSVDSCEISVSYSLNNIHNTGVISKFIVEEI